MQGRSVDSKLLVFIYLGMSDFLLFWKIAFLDINFCLIVFFLAFLKVMTLLHFGIHDCQSKSVINFIEDLCHVMNLFIFYFSAAFRNLSVFVFWQFMYFRKDLFEYCVDLYLSSNLESFWTLFNYFFSVSCSLYSLSRTPITCMLYTVQVTYTLFTFISFSSEWILGILC